MNGRFGEQIGLPGNHFFNQQMQESGLEMTIEPATLFGITMAASAVSGGMSMIGSMQQADAQQSAANDRADQAKEMAEWNWEERKRQESYAQYEVDLARINNETVANFTDQIALDKYNRELYIKDYRYKNEVNAYNKTEQQYAQQVDYNAIAATLARDEQTLWLDEQLQQAGFDREGLILDTDKKLRDIGFDREELILDTDKKLKDIGFDYKEIANILGEQKDLFASQRQTINLQQQQARAKASFDIQQNQIKGMQDEGKAKAMGQAGRTARKNRQAALATAGLTQAALVDTITRADSVFNLQRLQNYQKYGYQRLAADLKEDRLGALAEFTQATSALGHRKLGSEAAFTQSTSALGHRKVNASMTSAQAKNQANLLRIEHDQYGADMSAENRRLTPPPAYEDLPEIPPPYYTPEVIIPDAYKTKKKPPGPVGAPNLTAGAGLMAAGQAMGTIASAVAAYTPSTPNYSGVGGGSVTGSQTGAAFSAGTITGPIP
tara:strand:+ start:1129 stop:2610 length:1482 start_codon:yes stop_codon:yes gene_type:complete